MSPYRGSSPQDIKREQEAKAQGIIPGVMAKKGKPPKPKAEPEEKKN